MESGRAESVAVPRSVFFGFLPAPAQREVLEGATREGAAHVVSFRPVRPRKRHVTLLYLGQFLPEHRDDVAARASAAVRGVAGDAFELTLDSLAVFGRDSLVLAASQVPVALQALWDAVVEAMLRAEVLRKPPPALRPHLTLGHVRGGVLPDMPVQPRTLRFDELVLLGGNPGEAHVQFGVWPLTGGDAGC